MVCARWVQSSILTYRSILEDEGLGRRVDIPLEALGLVEPDMTFLLTATEEIRRRRLEARGKMTAQDSAVRERTRFMIEGYRRLAAHEIETSELAPEQVLDRLCEIIG